ncbi:acyl-protein thioesterase [Nemania sp. FL0031]|nr:acyl-protein thioesterase [Nemania sp. FL0031]
MNHHRGSTGHRAPGSPYIVEPKAAAHTHTIILLHELDANGERWGRELLAQERTGRGKLPDLLPSARFVFPTAQLRRVSAFRRRHKAWFDIAGLHDPSLRKDLQRQGLDESAAEIRKLLQDEAADVGPENIIIGGIGQGCAMALSVLLSLEYRIGGFIGTRGYLPYQKEIEEAIKGSEAGSEAPSDGGEEAIVFNLSDDEQMKSTDPAIRVLKFERKLLGLGSLPKATVEQTAVETPVFLAHGEAGESHGQAEEKKAYVLGETATKTLREAGYNVDWELYSSPGCWYRVPGEIDDIINFIRNRVGWEIVDNIVD